MSDPASPASCAQCGAPLAEGSPMGLCPACLLRQGIGTHTAVPGTPGAHHVFTPPMLNELAEHFPQLEILQLIGQGGMGAVYKARQPALDRLVALKILPPQTAARDPGFTERFNREARALARLSHPHIVHVHDFGQAGGFYYFLMEYVDGANLRQLEHVQQLTPQQALAIVPQICEALQYAHDQGVVHRDIKPENILVSKQGQVKIADFGVAKIVGAEKSPITLTNAGQIMGTPLYMAPEQVEKPSEVDHRADIYSLGVVFYEMLTGELPLGRFAAPSRKVQIDVRLDEVVLRALEKEPGLRYQQAGEFKTEVETVANGPAPAGAPVRLDKPTGPRRFSRKAIVGAAWAVCFFIAFVMMFVPRTVQAGQYHGPSWWQYLLMFTLLPVGFTAPFGATILGWVAVGQIRRSAGRIYGLSLALFDGLLFPLLALDAGLAALIQAFGIGFLHWSRFYSDKQNSQLIFLSGIAWVAADALIIWWVWRKLHPRPNLSVSSSMPSASAKNPASSQPEGGARWLRAALLTVAAVVLLLIALSVGSLLLASFLPAHRRAQMQTAAPAPLVHAEAHAPYIARLPFGATAELCAVSNHSQDGGNLDRVWWQPDGTVFKNAWFLAKGSRSYPSKDQIAREFFLRVENMPPGADSGPVWKLDPSGSWAGGEVVNANDGEYAPAMKMISATFPASARTVTVRAGFGLGPWETLTQQTPGRSSEIQGASRDGRQWRVSFLPAAEFEGGARVTTMHKVEDQQVRVTAIDASGVEHTAGRTEGGGADAFNHTTVTFGDLPLAQVEEFRFQVRPYSWVEFRNVSLNPNQKTAVEVADASGSAPQPVSGGQTGPGDFQSIVPYPMTALTLAWDGSRQSYPDLLAYLAALRDSDEYREWLSRRDNHFFRETNAAGFRFEAHFAGMGRIENGGLNELIPSVKLFRPDNKLLAEIVLGSSDAQRWDTEIYDEQGRKVTRLQWSRDPDTQRAFISRVVFDPGTPQTHEWMANRFGVVYSDHLEHKLPQYENAPYPLPPSSVAASASVDSSALARDDQRRMLELQLKQAQAEAERVERLQQVGQKPDSEMQEAKDKVELLRAQIEGGLVRIAEVKLAAAERRVERFEKLTNAAVVPQAEVEDAKNQRDLMRLQLQQAQALAALQQAKDAQDAPREQPPAAKGKPGRQLADARIALIELRGKHTENDPQVQAAAARVEELARMADSRNASYLVELKTKLAEWEVEQTELATKYGENHPARIAMQQKISAIRELLQAVPEIFHRLAARKLLDEGHEMLALQLKQAQAAAEQAESLQKAGAISASEAQHARDTVDILRAQFYGNPAHVAEVKLAAVERRLDLAEKQAGAGFMPQAELEEIRNERDQMRLQLQQMQARAASPAPSPASSAP